MKEKKGEGGEGEGFGPGLLEAIGRFDRLADPLDLSMGGRHLDEFAAAEAIKAGRTLSRLARKLVQKPEDEVEEDRGLYGDFAP
jgi:hypothetical protein